MYANSLGVYTIDCKKYIAYSYIWW